jgi:hypothetical protein
MALPLVFSGYSDLAIFGFIVNLANLNSNKTGKRGSYRQVAMSGKDGKADLLPG